MEPWKTKRIRFDEAKVTNPHMFAGKPVDGL